MSPLVDHLLSVLRSEPDCMTRAWIDSEAALNELGYWVLLRPADMTREEMSEADAVCIRKECRLVCEIPTYTPGEVGCLGITEDGFATVADVYCEQDADVLEVP